MAYYAGQGRKSFSAAQLAAMEEERKKRLAEAKANQAIMLEKDRTWRDKLAGRVSLQGQYNEAYPESAPRGLLDEFVYKLTLKYLRRDGFDIGNRDRPEIKKLL
jgi:hypothetical protein